MFLGFDRSDLNRVLSAWRRQFAELRELMDGDPLAGTMHGPAEAVVESVHLLGGLFVLPAGAGCSVTFFFGGMGVGVLRGLRIDGPRPGPPPEAHRPGRRPPHPDARPPQRRPP